MCPLPVAQSTDQADNRTGQRGREERHPEERQSEPTRPAAARGGARARCQEARRRETMKRTRKRTPPPFPGARRALVDAPPRVTQPGTAGAGSRRKPRPRWDRPPQTGNGFHELSLAQPFVTATREERSRLALRGHALQTRASGDFTVPEREKNLPGGVDREHVCDLHKTPACRHTGSSAKSEQKIPLMLGRSP